VPRTQSDAENPNPEVALAWTSAQLAAFDRLEHIERQYRLRLEIRDDPSLRRDEIRLFRGKTFEEITKQYEH